ncbi:MAG: DNA alkylation repair protein [Firmicutes bacterium]|nr:DNA alkylation repair protein [Bacillota bacterium]
MKEEVKRIREDLLAMRDEPYRQFSLPLIPVLEPERMIGIRAPKLKAYGKGLKGTAAAEDFLRDLPHKYHEENCLHACLINSMKAFGPCLEELQRFLPYVDNWAVSDSISPKVFEQHREELLPVIRKWMESPEPYTVRVAVKLLMDFYLGSAFREEHLDWVASIRSEEYYVNMMVAWYLATALAKQYRPAVSVLEERRLPVWTHNMTIRKARESFRINKTQKEYLNSLKAEPLSEKAILRLLKGEGKAVTVLPLTDSTNRLAKEAARKGAPHGTVILAEEQTAGRGRRGRALYSPPGRGLYLSFVLCTREPLTEGQLLTVYAAVAVRRALEAVLAAANSDAAGGGRQSREAAACKGGQAQNSAAPAIKWVNDIYLGDRKVCGILTELIDPCTAVLGIGINVSGSDADFPEDIRGKAGSLTGTRSEEGISRNALAAAVIREVLAWQGGAFPETTLEEYRRHSFLLGREVEFERNGQWFTGTAASINDSGNLLVELASGETMALSSGEVSVRQRKELL